MPKLRHEAVVEILQNEPELILHLLAGAGMHLQLGTRVAATTADSNLSDRDANGDGRQVRNLFSDNVFVFDGDGHRVAVIAEVQTDRPDTERSLSWPAYVANARRRHRCDTLLMIFAITKNAARGSAQAIRTGHPGWDLIPLVSGIGRTPGVPLKGARFAAELVLLRVITGELTLGTHDARMFALGAIRSAPPERLARYTKYLKALAPPSVRESLEMLMRIELKDAFVDGLINEGLARGRSEGLAVGYAAGRAEGIAEARAETLLELLDMRFSVPADVRKRVEECTDPDQVKAWLRRVPDAASLEEVFAEPEAE